MVYPSDPSFITEAMIMQAIQDEEKLEHSGSPQDLASYRPTPPDKTKLLRLSFYSKNKN